MILHRLRLNNFRGVEGREISFPDTGVVVVCGPNEIGKSSMLEALDLLLMYRDRSTHRDVKQVKPAHADVGAEVEAEISTGPYRFVYRKRFHKKHLTELDVIEPKREHLTGDEAHERVEAMLKETLDVKLWDAQRVLQSASTNAVNLSGSDALSRALDAAAGEAATGASGGDSLLIDRIDAEFERYFTPNAGKPTKDWKAVIDRVKAAEAEVCRCAAAVEEVNERVCRHEELTATLAALDVALEPATERLTAARKAHAVVTELSEQLGQARLVATAAAATGANSALANGQRQQLVVDADRRAETFAGLRTQLAAAEQEEAGARQAAQDAEGASGESVAALDATRQRREAAQAAAAACAARIEASRLGTLVERIDEALDHLQQADEQLAVITLTDDVLEDIEAGAALVERLESQLRSEAGAIEFTPATDLTLTVDGEPITLAAGQAWASPASAPMTVDLPGVLTVRIDPGPTAVKLRADLIAAQRIRDEALAQGGVADLATARATGRRRRDLDATRRQLAASIDGLCAGVDIAQLRAQLADMRAATAEPGVDADTATAELAAATDAFDQAGRAAQAQQQLVAAAAAALAESTSRTTVLRVQVQTADDECGAVLEQLMILRALVSDEDVAAQAIRDAEALGRADEDVATLSERYAAADPGAVEAELALASEAAATIAEERDATKLALHNLIVELGVIGSEGREGRLDEAQAELERARTEHTRIQQRASAAQMLRNTMIRHRDNTRQRYVQPYRTELERLGREVFGSTFEVEVDTELTIRARTLKGRTVPFDSLSGGAKEQLGILARLAGAALVAKEDTVPVVIDDALGFSDPDRLIKMGAVLNTVGDRGQVIVLTCTPGRYDGVADAEVIELTA